MKKTGEYRIKKKVTCGRAVQVEYICVILMSCHKNSKFLHGSFKYLCICTDSFDLFCVLRYEWMPRQTMC